MNFVGVRASDGKRVYVRDSYVRKHALAYAVYAIVNRSKGCLGLVARIEDRPHKDERVWNGGSWIPAGRDLSPLEVAEQTVIWWTKIGNTTAEAVRLWPTKSKSSPADPNGKP